MAKPSACKFASLELIREYLTLSQERNCCISRIFAKDYLNFNRFISASSSSVFFNCDDDRMKL